MYRAIAIALLVFILPLSEASPQQPSPGPIDKGGPTQAQVSAPPQNDSAQVSGQVLRADSGEPIPGVVVTLARVQDPAYTEVNGDITQRTGPDGSYQFKDVAPGKYWVAAYRTGFIGALYVDKAETQGPPCNARPNCLLPLSISAGQKATAIDLELTPDPAITSLPEGPILSAHPDITFEFGTFGPGRFSPDEKYFAIDVSGIPNEGTWWLGSQVWLYNVQSEELTPLAPKTGKQFEVQVDDLAWDGGTVYLTGKTITRHILLAVTNSGTKEISQLPPAIAGEFDHNASMRNESVVNANGVVTQEESNSKYVVTLMWPCHGCGMTLSMKRKDGSGERVIAGMPNGSNFLLDANDSEVFYLEPQSKEIGIFDLTNGKSQALPLPVAAWSLLDEIQDRGGYKVAYIAYAACEPDVASEETESQLLLPNSANLRRGVKSVEHVCFVNIPRHVVP